MIWKSFTNLCLGKLGRENLHDISMLHSRGLVVLVVLFDKDGKGIWSLGCGAVARSLCLG